MMHDPSVAHDVPLSTSMRRGSNTQTDTKRGKTESGVETDRHEANSSQLLGVPRLTRDSPGQTRLTRHFTVPFVFYEHMLSDARKWIDFISTIVAVNKMVYCVPI